MKVIHFKSISTSHHTTCFDRCGYYQVFKITVRWNLPFSYQKFGTKGNAEVLKYSRNAYNSFVLHVIKLTSSDSVYRKKNIGKESGKQQKLFKDKQKRRNKLHTWEPDLATQFVFSTWVVRSRGDA
jgi:hypothetical protein